MKHVIEIHLTKHRMPEPHELVIVDGGIAIWTGSVWLSQSNGSGDRPIRWPVTWWTPLLCDIDLASIDNEPEPLCVALDMLRQQASDLLTSIERLELIESDAARQLALAKQ